MARHTEQSALASIARKNSAKIDHSKKTIEIAPGSTAFGNGSWGKLDFLSNHCGWTVKNY